MGHARISRRRASRVMTTSQSGNQALSGEERPDFVHPLLDLVNGLVLGIYTAMFHRQDLAWEWWAWILPHGVTEILAIVLMSGGGLLIGYRIVNPGHDSRVAALQGIRREILYLLIFAFPMFFVAALIESFVRQSGLSDTGRYLFAAATLVFWIFYLRWGKVPESVRTRFAAERTAAELVNHLLTAQEIDAGELARITALIEERAKGKRRGE